MALVQSLLTAIVRADGDALVMHVGERPYVIASSGTIELSAHGLNLEAMSGMLGQLLPHDALRALGDFGAIEHDLEPPTPIPGERFTVVAARGGEDVWIELRRHRRARRGGETAAEPVPATPEAAPMAPEEPLEARPSIASSPEAVAVPHLAQVETHVASVMPDIVAAGEPESSLSPALEASTPADLGSASDDQSNEPQPLDHAPYRERVDEPLPQEEPVSALVPDFTPPALAAADASPFASFDTASPAQVPGAPAKPAPSVSSAPSAAVPSVSSAPSVPVWSVSSAASSPAAPSAPSASSAAVPLVSSAPSAAGSAASDRWDESAAVVVPLTRSMRIESGPRGLSSRPGGIDRLLRVAASRGASALYLSSQGRPHIRVDGDMRLLEGEPVLTSTDVESAVLELMPESAGEALRRGEPTEWVSDLADIGRIRCTTFRDYRGPGALFQMIAARAASAEQLGLSREIQALSTESEGLVIVAGPRGSGKSTLIAAFVDLASRRRADYVITLERQIRLVHDNRSSLISQREIRGSAEEIVAQARAALRENPDVLVIEDLRSPEVLQVALDAAGSGLLVFISVTAASTTAAIERVVDLVPAERKRPVLAMLGETLRGVVIQVLLRKSGGGRLAARELLLNTAAVASLVTDGQTSQLPLAIDSGRRHGMVPLNDALVAFVQSGAVDVREVYHKAADRRGLLTLLQREGIDTSFAERLA